MWEASWWWRQPRRMFAVEQFDDGYVACMKMLNLNYLAIHPSRVAATTIHPMNMCLNQMRVATNNSDNSRTWKYIYEQIRHIIICDSNITLVTVPAAPKTQIDLI